MAQNFFPKRVESNPKIYAYEDTNPQYAGMLKVGYTTKEVKERVAQQYPTLRPGALPYRIVLEESAMRNDGTAFTDHDVHRLLREMNIENPEGEWFCCGVKEVKTAINTLRSRSAVKTNRSASFAMRPEQKEAVEKTSKYFK
jgi:hypothetical protein